MSDNMPAVAYDDERRAHSIEVESRAAGRLLLVGASVACGGGGAGQRVLARDVAFKIVSHPVFESSGSEKSLGIGTTLALHIVNKGRATVQTRQQHTMQGLHSRGLT